MLKIDPQDELICLRAHDRGHDGAVLPPIAQASLFRHPTMESLLDGLAHENERFVYSRGSNPTVKVLEETLSALERGETCKCLASGMGAVSAVLFGLLKAGDHVLFVNDIYGPTIELAERLADFGITHSRCFAEDVDGVAHDLRDDTRMIYMESPGSTLFRLLPIADLCVLAKSQLNTLFHLGIPAAIPLVIAVAGIAMRQPPALVIVVSSVSALVVGVLVQGFPVAAALTTFVDGFDVGVVIPAATMSESLTNLLNRGGVFSMAPTLMYIIAAFLLAGAMHVCGALATLLATLLSIVRSAFGLVAATLAAGAIMVGMTSHGGVTSLIVGGLFRQPYADRGLAPENLSRAIEDSVVVTEPLMPWTVSALFMATTLGVATVDYFPWAIFCSFGPLFSLIFAAAYEFTGFGLKRAAVQTPAE